MIFSATSKIHPFLGRGSTYPPLQSLIPMGIVSAEGFGTNQLNLIVCPSGAASTEAFGNSDVGTTLVLHAAIFFRPATRRYPFFGRLAGGGIFPQTLIAEGVASAEVFGTASIILPPQSVIVSGIGSGEVFGAVTVVPGVVLLLPTGIASVETFGTTQVIQLTGGLGAVIFRPHAEMTPFLSRPLKGTPAIGNQFLVINGIGSAETFGNLSLDLDITVFPTSTGTQEGFGTSKIILYLKPGPIATGESLGTPEITVGEVLILPVSVGSDESLGSPIVTGGSHHTRFLIFRRRRTK